MAGALHNLLAECNMQYFFLDRFRDSNFCRSNKTTFACPSCKQDNMTVALLPARYPGMSGHTILLAEIWRPKWSQQGFHARCLAILILNHIPGGTCSSGLFEFIPVRGYQWPANRRACVIKDHDWWISPSGYLTNCPQGSRLRFDALALGTAQVKFSKFLEA